MTSRTVSLIVVNYQTPEMALRLLNEVAPAVNELIVVDNSPPAYQVSDHDARMAGARVVHMQKNRGYGAAANEGFRHSTGDVVVISNADISITSHDLRLLAETVGTRDNAICAPRFFDAAGSLIPSSHFREPGLRATLWDYCYPCGAVWRRVTGAVGATLHTPERHERDHETGHVLGALLAIDRTVFADLGGFDESFVLYREETDLCRRARDRGCTVRHVASVQAVHIGDASGGADDRWVPVRPIALASHYNYIAKHRGRAIAAVAWVLGMAGSLVWIVVGRRRDQAVVSLRSHFRYLGDRHPTLADQ